MNKLGPQLKKIRIEKRLTLRQVAEKVNLSESLLSQIENSKLSPSLQSLQDILAYYAVNLSEFFRQVEQKHFIIQKKDQKQAITNGEIGLSLTLLASKLEHNTLESFEVKMIRGSKLMLCQFKEEQNGERFGYVLSGSVQCLIDNTEFILEEGDSINLKAHVHTVFICVSDTPCTMLIIGDPPIIA